MAPDDLLSQEGMQIIEGSFGSMVFMEPIIEPLKETYKTLNDEFPGLPHRNNGLQKMILTAKPFIQS